LRRQHEPVHRPRPANPCSAPRVAHDLPPAAQPG
jgi:hypothetical protein